jgi:hypothetical protein
VTSGRIEKENEVFGKIDSWVAGPLALDGEPRNHRNGGYDGSISQGV